MKILNMFDVDVKELITGPEIDRTRNAITLTPTLHRIFGNFEIFFKPVEDKKHSYKIDAFDRFVPHVPVTRDLFLTRYRNIDPPAPRLLALHCAIAHVLHLSGAGEYIDRMFRDWEETGVLSNETAWVFAHQLKSTIEDQKQTAASA